MNNNYQSFSQKNIDFNVLKNFSRNIYANPWKVAGIEVLQFVIFIVIIYFYNPFNIKSNYPVFTKILLLFVAFIYVVLFFFIRAKVDKGDDVDLIDMTESNFLYRAVITILLFVVFFLVLNGIIWMFKHTSLLNAIRNSMTILIVIGIFGFLYMFMKKSIDTETKSDKKGIWSVLLKIIMFLPCLMVELTEYIKSEYNLTTKPVWILVGIESIFITLWLVIPTLFSFLSKNDGTKLLNKPVYLNKEYNIGNYEKLYRNVDLIKTNKKPNYITDDKENCDAKIYKKFSNANSATTAEYNDPNIPNNKILAWFYKKFLLNPVGIQMNLDVHPQYSDNNTTPFKYAYALSGWFYINPQPPNSRSSALKYTNIIKYGDKVKVEYNGKLGSLHVLGNVPSKSDDETVKNELVEIYETKNVMYQKWNHIVINYDNGHLDIFLNGDLVGTRSGVSPYMTFDDIIIGENNGINGGICNVTYYDEILTKGDVVMMYKTLRGQNIPYNWSFTDNITDTIVKKEPSSSFIKSLTGVFTF